MGVLDDIDVAPHPSLSVPGVNVDVAAAVVAGWVSSGGVVVEVAEQADLGEVVDQFAVDV